MITGWFDAREAEAFGNMLAEFYDEKFHTIEKAAAHKKLGKQQKLVAQVLLKAEQFKAAHKLNPYKKAKLGNAFKWKLRELGHHAELIDQMAKDLMLALR